MNKNCRCKNTKNCVCRKKRPSITSQTSSTSDKRSLTSGYASTKSVTSQVPSVSTRQSAPDPFPSTLNCEPNVYYYTKDGLVGSEESNLYYQISKVDSNISDYIYSKLAYTDNREYFESIEKLRFRLPTANEYCLPGNPPPAEELEKRIEAVCRFRANNLDDCIHEEEQQFRKNHRCVHRYRLNRRGFPEPLLKDEDGNSLCSDPTCYSANKYMIDNNISPTNCPNKYVVPNGELEEFAKEVESEPGPVLLLEAPPINNEEEKKKQVTWSGRPKKQNPRDTYPIPGSVALKHQKRMDGKNEINWNPKGEKFNVREAIPVPNSVALKQQDMELYMRTNVFERK